MTKKIERIPELNLTVEQCERELALRVLELLRTRKNGLEAALLFCFAVETSLPDWAARQFIIEHFENHTKDSRPRLQQRNRKIDSLLKSLLRYKIVCLCEGERFGERNDKFEAAIEQLQKMALQTSASRLKESHYRIEHTFGGSDLTRYVADRVMSAWITRLA